MQVNVYKYLNVPLKVYRTVIVLKVANQNKYDKTAELIIAQIDYQKMKFWRQFRSFEGAEELQQETNAECQMESKSCLTLNRQYQNIVE